MFASHLVDEQKELGIYIDRTYRPKPSRIAWKGKTAFLLRVRLVEYWCACHHSFELNPAKKKPKDINALCQSNRFEQEDYPLVHVRRGTIADN